jgi:selenocysteine lyase/cysteine desulfurase
MTSRRKFIKAGILSGLTTIPFSGNSLSETTSVDFRLAANDDELFAMARRQLLIPENRIYLNTGTLGPSPLPVIETVSKVMRQLEMNPANENFGPLGNEMELVRKKVADFIHCDINEVLLTRNTTEGLNLIAQSLPLKEGDEIITTTLEHGGLEVGLEFMTKTKGVIVKKVELPLPGNSSEEIVEAINKNISNHTKMILLSHVNTITGLLMPFEAISKITQPKGIYLIADGAQAPGLVKIDVKKLGVDAYATSGHKWLLGPKETGFLYLDPRIQNKVTPIFTLSGFTAYSASSGTRNVATILGLGSAIDWHTQIGIEKIQERALQLRNYCLAELKKIKGVKIISPEARSLSTGIVSFSLLSAKNNEVADTLKQQDIIVKVLPQLNAIRISCHCFISKKDIDTFLKELRKRLL